MKLKTIEGKLAKLARKLKKAHFIEGNVSCFEITIYPSGDVHLQCYYFEYPDYKDKPVFRPLDKWI